MLEELGAIWELGTGRVLIAAVIVAALAILVLVKSLTEWRREFWDLWKITQGAGNDNADTRD